MQGKLTSFVLDEVVTESAIVKSVVLPQMTQDKRIVATQTRSYGELCVGSGVTIISLSSAPLDNEKGDS